MVDGIFAERLEAYGVRTAIITGDGTQWSYGELARAADRAAACLQGPAALVIVEAANTLPCIIAYLACLRARFPVLLAEPGSTARDPRIANTFRPAYVFRETAADGWRFEAWPAADGSARAPVHPELAVLLSTSGSTGSPKLVRLSRENIGSNAAAIIDYLGIGAHDRAITALPLYYSYGMSVLNSHLQAGACILLTEESVAQDSFWLRVEREQATSLAGVPFTFDIMERIGFRSRRYPALRYLTQAGGRMARELVLTYEEWASAQGKQFFVMYGQTEASPRMAYVPPGQLRDNPHCIGIPIPGGSFELLGADGEPELRHDQPAELVYRGPNVMMGYAECSADLALGKLVDVLHTGDMASRKADGMYYIVGRLSRFSKIVGLRISLDEIEHWLEAQGINAIVAGDDELVAVGVAQHGEHHELKQRLLKRFGLPEKALEIATLNPLPTLPTGKVDFRAVLRLVREAAGRHHGEAPRSLQEGFADILGIASVRPTQSFLDLGGDSVSFVEISLLLEEYLGHAPENWQAMPVATLEAMKAQAGQAAPASAPARRGASFRWAAAACVLVLFAGEAALQARAYMRTGRSAVGLLLGRSATYFNQQWGVTTYRPNNVLEVPLRNVRFETNSLGLRSPEIGHTPASNELRLAIAGASTVAGSYAKRNADTFSSLLEGELRSSLPGQVVNVINAGIEGHTLEETSRVVEGGLVGLHPAMVIVYPGFNNELGKLCEAATVGANRPGLHPLPSIGLPKWILSHELISKNTLELRRPPERTTHLVTPGDQAPATYTVTLRAMVHKLRQAQIQPVLMTVARGYKGMDSDVGRKMAETTLYYNPCLDFDGLKKVVRTYNEAIRQVAREENVVLLDLATAMPVGQQYYVDAIHFTAAGEHFVADYLARELRSRKLLPPPPSVDAAIAGNEHVTD